MSNVEIKNKQPSELELFDCLVIKLSPDFIITYMNSFTLSLFNWQVSDVIDKCFYQLLEKSGFQNLIPKKFSLQKKSLPLRGIQTKIQSKKQELTISWKICPCLDANNILEKIVLIGTDLTTQLSLEDKVYELDSIIAQMPGNVYWYDKNFTYLGCNDNSAKTLCMSREEAIGRDIRTLFRSVRNITDESINEWIKDGLDVIQTQKPKLNLEVPPFVGPDNTHIHTIDNKVPLFTRTGEFRGVLGVTIDITERKKAEEELRKAKQKADVALMLMNKDSLKLLVEKVKGRAISLIIDSVVVHLSSREAQCLLYLLRGETAKYIAKEMGLSPRTVESYVEILKNKTNTHSKAALANKAIIGGLLESLI